MYVQLFTCLKCNKGIDSRTLARPMTKWELFSWKWALLKEQCLGNKNSSQDWGFKVKVVPLKVNSVQRRIVEQFAWWIRPLPTRQVSTLNNKRKIFSITKDNQVRITKHQKKRCLLLSQYTMWCFLWVCGDWLYLIKGNGSLMPSGQVLTTWSSFSGERLRAPRCTNSELWEG